MGGARRWENGVLILCQNGYTDESFISDTVADASLRTGVSKSYISTLIKTGSQTKEGWTFDEWDSLGGDNEAY